MVASAFLLLWGAGTNAWAGPTLDPLGEPSALVVDREGVGPSEPQTAEHATWSITLYGGRLTADGLDEIVSISPDMEDAYIAVLALAKEFGVTGRHIRWEVEAQASKHFGRQNHWEFNALLVGRWVTFPWDRYVDTEFAVGDGLSYATEVPRLEAKTHRRTQRLLNYLMFELSFSAPYHPEWALVTRLHHRSGLFGLFGGVRGASNVLTVGIRYRF